MVVVRCLRLFLELFESILQGSTVPRHFPFVVIATVGPFLHWTSLHFTSSVHRGQSFSRETLDI
jgi:hypothetical protein